MAATGPTPDGIILMRELGRRLTVRDVADITGVPVIAKIPVTAAVARTIDAGQERPLRPQRDCLRRLR